MVSIVAGANLGLFNASEVETGSKSGIEANGENISVNAVTGNLILQRSDELVVGKGLDTNVIRTYNSQGHYGDDSYNDFYFSFNQRLETYVAGVYAIRVNGDGFEQMFTYDAQRCLYVSAQGDGAYDTLQCNGTTWTYVEGSSGLTETYDLGHLGKMTSQLNREGLGITSICYDLLNRVSTLTDSSGQTLTVQRDAAGNICSLSTTSNGVTLRTVRYSYETYLDCSSLIKTRLHQVTLDLTPGDDNIGDGNVFTTTYSYVDIPCSLFSTDLVQSITQSDGNSVSFMYDGYDSNARVTQVTVGSGSDAQVTEYAYANGSTQVKQKLASGAYAITTINYDCNGYVTSVVTPPDANGQRLTTSYTYDSAGNVIKMVDARNNATYYQYDARGNLVLEQNAQGDTTQYVYDSRNLLLNEIHYTGRDSTPGTAVINPGAGNGTNDATGALVTRYIYDNAQRLRFVVQADGSVKETRYSDSGSGSSATRTITDITYLEDVYPLVGIAGVTPALQAVTPLQESNLINWLATLADKSRAQVKTTVLDFRGQVAQVTTYAKTNIDGSGDTSTAATNYLIYDTHGNLLRSVDARGSSAADTAYDTIYTYDGAGRPLSIARSTGPTTSQTITTLYDDAHSAVVTTQANGLLVTRSYNTAGVLTLTQESATSSSTALSTTRNVYDNVGLLRAVVDPVGGTRYYFYDELGRQVGVIDGTGALTETLYDGVGNVIETIAYANFVSATAIAALATQVASGIFAASTNTDALSGIRPAGDAQNDRIAQKQYNVAGLLMREIDSKGVTTDYVYDGDARLLSVTVSDGTTPRTTRYFYDAAGRQCGELDPDNYYTEYKYNLAGQVVETVRHAAPVTLAQVSANNDNALSLNTMAPALGNQLFTVPEGMPYTVGSLVRLAANGGAVYMEGLVASYNGAALVVAVDTVMGSATSATWQLSAAVYPRAQFSIAPTMLSGSKTFTTQPGLPYSVGTAVRLTADNGDWLQGTVTAYSGDQMTVNVGTVCGIGLHTGWDLTAANASNGMVIAPSLGSKTFGVPAGLNYNLNDRVRLSANNGASYMEGLITALSGDRMTVAVDTAVGTSAALTWQISQATPSCADFSISPLIMNGSKTFTTQIGLPYVVGSVVRLSANGGAAWMQGAVTAYSGDQMTVNVTSNSGIGLYSHWNLGLGNIASASFAIPTAFPVTKTFTVPSGLSFPTSTRVRFTAAGGSAWVEGTVQSYGSGSMSVAIDRASGSGTYSSWLLAAEQVPTSGTSLSVGTGYKTFTVQAGLSYPAGSRVRFSADNGATYMEGTVLSYVGTSMAVTVDTIAGSGTRSNWQLSSAGSALNALAPSTGTKTFNVQAGLAYSVGQRVRFVASGDTSTWMEGVLQTYNGTAMTVAVDQIGGSGSYANWQLAADIAPVSATSLSVGLGSMTFTTASSLPYAVGSRVRLAASGGAVYMEGVVTAYCDISMTVNVDTTVGSGTYNYWQLSSERSAVDTAVAALGGREFSVPSGLAYTTGTRVRFVADNGDAWMEGVITAYNPNGTRMQVTIDAAFGNTAYSYWQLTAPLTASANDIHTYTIYDRRGNEIASIDGEGFVTETQRNITDTASALIRYSNSLTQARSVNAGQLAAALAAVGGDASRLTLAAIRPSANAATDDITQYTYDTLNQLIAETDARGNISSYTYNSEGQLLTTDITPAGNNATASRKDQRIYDIQGHLIEERFARYFDASDADGYQLAKNTFTVDAAGNRVSTTDENGNTAHYIYNAEGRLLYSIDNARALTAYTYNSFGEQQAAIGYAQPLPAALALTASAIAAYVSAPTVADRKTVNYYDTAGELRYSIDALGYVTENRYDTLGNRIEKIVYQKPVANFDLSNPSALNATGAYDVHYVYDAANRLRFIIDAKDHVTENRYDDFGRVSDRVEWFWQTPQTLTAFTLQSVAALLPNNATGYLTRFEYDKLGQVTAQVQQSNITVDANGQRSAASDIAAQYFVYDAFGSVQFSVDALGFVTEHRYDAMYNAITDIRYQPALATADVAAFRQNPQALLSANHFTVFSSVQRYYDAEGQLIYSVDPEGYVTRLTYDSDGNVVQSRTYQTLLWNSSTAAGLDPQQRPAQSVLDAFAQQQNAGSNNKSTESTVYDALNRKQMTIDANRYVTEFVYDAVGNVSEEIHYSKPLPNNVSLDANSIRTALGLLESNHQPKIASQQFLYADVFGQTTYTLDASGIVREAIHDAAGNVVRNRVYRTPFWGAQGGIAVVNRVQPSADDIRAFVQAQDALQNATDTTTFHNEKASVYDALGEPLYYVDSEGYVTAYVYDDFGHVIRESKTRQQIVVGTSLDALTLQQFVDNHDSVVSDNYYQNGQLQIAVDGAGNVASYSYDTLGNKISEAHFTAVFTDVRSQSALQTFVNDQTLNHASAVITTRFAYDADGQLRFKIDANGYVTEYRYDAAGNAVQLLRYTSAYNGSSASAFTLVALQQAYANAATLPANVSVQNYYDADGRVKLAIDEGNYATAYSYDANGNVIATYRTQQPLTNAQLVQSADTLIDTIIAGQIAARASFNVYDGIGQLLYNIDGEGYVTAYSYDALGNRILTERYSNRITLNAPALVFANAGLSTLPATANEVESQQRQLVLQNDRIGSINTFIAGQGTQFTVTERVAYDATHNSRVIADGLGHVVREVYNDALQLASRTQYGADLQLSSQQLSDLNFDFVQYVADHASATAHVSTYEYDTEGRLSATVDALGNREELTYDFAGNVVQRTSYDVQSGPIDVAGDYATRTTHYIYDADNRLRYEIDGENYVKETRYDGAGRVTDSIQWAKVLSGNTSYSEHDVCTTLGALSETTDDSVQHLDQRTHYVYDAVGNVITQTDALGHSDCFTYDYAGNCKTQTAKDNSVWNFTYDKLGRLTDKASPSVKVATFANGQVDASQAETDTSITTHYVYDAFGNTVEETQAYNTDSARKTTFVYDNLDRLTIATQVGAGANGANVVRQQWYDANGNVVVTRDVDGHYSYKAYDAANQLRFEVNADDYATEYNYDAFGNVKKLTRYANKIGAHDAGTKLLATAPGTLIQSDRTQPGNLVLSDSANDRSIACTYDALNRETQRMQTAVYTLDATNPAAAGYMAHPTTNNAYNGFGEVISVTQTAMIDGSTATQPTLTTQYFYNQRGEKSAEINAGNYKTEWQYDAAGNITQVTEYEKPGNPPPSGKNRVSQNTYNAVNLLVQEKKLSVEYYNVSAGAMASADSVTSYTYDLLNHVKTLTDANSNLVSYEYDSLGWLRSITEPARKLADDASTTVTPITTYSYDYFGNQVKEVRSAGQSGVANQTLRTGFDALGHQIWKQDAMGNIAYSFYNNAGVLEHMSQSVTDADGATTIVDKYYQHDNRGNQTAMTQSYQSGTGVQSTTHWIRYNAFGEVEARGAFAGNSNPVPADATAFEMFTHDQAGHLLRTNANDGVVHLYGYDFAGRQVLDVTDNSENNFVGINSLAQLRDGAQWQSAVYSSREYDGMGHVTAEHGIAINDNGDIPTTTKTYDHWGNVLDVSDTRGVHTSYSYDFANRVLQTKQYLSSSETETIVTKNYYDLMGNLLGVLDGNNHLSQKSYNAVGQLLKQWNSLNETTYYNYDGFGRVTSEKSPLNQTRTNTYDDNNNLTDTSVDNSTSTQDGEHVSSTYDQLGRKISSTVHYRGGDETTKYFYDGSDNIYKTIAPHNVPTDAMYAPYKSSFNITTESGYDQYGNKTQEKITLGGGVSLSVSLATFPPSIIVTPRADTTTEQSWTFNSDTSGYFHRITQHTEPGVTVNYSYGAGNRLVTENYGGSTSKTYTYYSNGKQHTIAESYSDVNPDLSFNATTTYSYDLSGNRTNETYVKNGVTYQDASSTFDALNRVIDIHDNRNDSDPDLFIHIGYRYDNVGNRIAVLDYSKGTDAQWDSKAQWYSYDAANRVLIAKGSKDVNGNVVCASDDQDALWTSYRADGSRADSVFFEDGLWVRELYIYNSQGLLSEVKRLSPLLLPLLSPSNLRIADTSLFSTYSSQTYDAKGRIATINKSAFGTQKHSVTSYTYDDATLTETSTTNVDEDPSKNVTTISTNINTKDITGKLITSVRVDEGKTGTTQDYKYTNTTNYHYRNGGTKIDYVDAKVVDNKTASANTRGSDGNKFLDDDTSTYHYDGFGNLIRVTHTGDGKDIANIDYQNNVSGQVLRRSETHGTDLLYFFNGQQIGEHYVPESSTALKSISGSGTQAVHPIATPNDGVFTLNGTKVKARSVLYAADNTAGGWDAVKDTIHNKVVEIVTQAVVYLNTLSDAERKSEVDNLITNKIKFNTSITVNSIKDEGNDDNGTPDDSSDDFHWAVEDTSAPFSDNSLELAPDKGGSIEAFFLQTVVQKLDEKFQGLVNGHRPNTLPYVSSFSLSFNLQPHAVADKGLDTDQFFNPISQGTGASTGSYTVRVGDTLQSIAAAIYGDSSLWYALADANGLSGTETLEAGQVLILPTVSATHNSTSAYKPYSPTEATGDVAPKLIFTPPAGLAPPADPCANVGVIFAIILAVLVAVVVTVITAGLAGPAFAAAFSGLGGALTAVGATSAGAAVTAAAASTAGGVVVATLAGAAAGFAGSLASQGIMMATGLQDSVDWAQAGVDALIGGLTFGAAGALKALSAAEKVPRVLSYAKSAADMLERSPKLSAAISLVGGAGSGLVSEGLLMAMDPKREVDWAHVAAFGLGMGAGLMALGKGASALRRVAKHLPGLRSGNSHTFTATVGGKGQQGYAAVDSATTALANKPGRNVTRVDEGDLSDVAANDKLYLVDHGGLSVDDYVNNLAKRNLKEVDTISVVACGETFDGDFGAQLGAALAKQGIKVNRITHFTDQAFVSPAGRKQVRVGEQFFNKSAAGKIESTPDQNGRWTSRAKYSGPGEKYSGEIGPLLPRPDPQNFDNTSGDLFYGIAAPRGVTITRLGAHASGAGIHTIDEYNGALGFQHVLQNYDPVTALNMIRRELAKPIGEPWTLPGASLNSGRHSPENIQRLTEWINFLKQNQREVGLLDMGDIERNGIVKVFNKNRLAKNAPSGARVTQGDGAYILEALNPNISQKMYQQVVQDPRARDLQQWISTALFRRTSKLGIDFATDRLGGRIHFNTAAAVDFRMDPTVVPGGLGVASANLRRQPNDIGYRAITISELRHVLKQISNRKLHPNFVNFYDEN